MHEPEALGAVSVKTFLCLATAVSALSSACSSPLPHSVNGGEPDASLAEGNRLARAGDVEAAYDRYLECLQRCSDASRMVAVDDLYTLGASRPTLERRVRELVHQLEGRVLLSQSPAESLQDDITVLSLVYERWAEREAVQRLLGKMRGAVPKEVYLDALEKFSMVLPKALTQLDAADVTLLLGLAEKGYADNRQILSEFPNNPEMVVMLCRVSVFRAVGFAEALATSAQLAAARTVVKITVDQFGPDACCELLAGSREGRNREAEEAVRDVCPTVVEVACGDPRPSGAVEREPEGSRSSAFE